MFTSASHSSPSSPEPGASRQPTGVSKPTHNSGEYSAPILELSPQTIVHSGKTGYNNGCALPQAPDFNSLQQRSNKTKEAELTTRGQNVGGDYPIMSFLVGGNLADQCGFVGAILANTLSPNFPFVLSARQMTWHWREGTTPFVVYQRTPLYQSIGHQIQVLRVLYRYLLSSTATFGIGADKLGGQE
ncbi:hypothetical protein PtA15_10A367 [Puccinia triticina]|uniref:Uncharacterized protein n=1 Tax=Puccinia triticina TaxID=208348 RepID=A0ABY7CWB8_9BASI|nr:uncharacterized protein PtA15_10A367 [Puccinia triticina]WAQ88944.1 hypothetical protein PtA15_10A367 [Puccinia triticina]WAR58996.1 hypothetical protein PtB15_10B338 [Puccinia triticina]